MGKLTKAQHEVLASLRWGPRYHLAITSTGKALVRKNLAHVNSVGVLSITVEGRAALEDGSR